MRFGVAVATIHIIQGPDKGRTYDLTPEEIHIGRESDDMHLTDLTVSRNHARLLPRGNLWMIEDLGSANGTYVNGVRLRRSQRLRQGDQIRVGNTLLVFGGTGPKPVDNSLDMDEDGRLVDSAIMASVPSSEDSVIMPTPEAGDQALGNLRLLYQFISTISTIFDVDLLFNRVLDNVCELLHPDRGYILIIDETDRMNAVAARYHDDKRDHKVPISRTIVNHVIDNQVGVLCSNAMRDKRFTKGSSVHDFGIRSVLCVPIVGRERIIGVIHVDTSVSNVTYSTEQLRLLTAIGYQTGLAVENVRLYESAVRSERLAAVGEAVASLSHGIKNILQALQAGADVVDTALKEGKPAKVTEAWPIVTRNLERINSLIVNMLAFSKHRQPLLQTVNVNILVSEVVDLVRTQASERGVKVMPRFSEIPPMPADPEGLHCALLNLLTNALDVVEDNVGEVTVSTRYDAMRRLAMIDVTDNGPGIDDETLQRLFEPFYSTKGHRGTGLGLAVAQKIVAEHGGRINVDTAPGQGTTFTVILNSAGGDATDSDDTLTPHTG